MKMTVYMNEIESKALVNLCNRLGANVSSNDIETRETVSRCGKASIVANENKAFTVSMEFNTNFIMDLMKMMEEGADLIIGFCRSVKFFIKDAKSKMEKWTDPIWECAIRDKFEEKHNDAWCIVAIEESKGCYVFGEINPCKPADGLKLISDNKGKNMYFGINADGEGRIEFVDMATVIAKLI